MERQSEPLTQKKPWSEMTEEERETIRESWKHTLPEEFDVFCIGELKYVFCEETPSIPGRLYVSGYVDCYDINVGEDFTVDGDVNCSDVDVGGDFAVDGDIDYCGDVDVGGDFTVDGDVAHCGDVAVAGNFTVDGDIDCGDVNISGCFTHGGKISCTSLEVCCEVPEEKA